MKNFIFFGFSTALFFCSTLTVLSQNYYPLPLDSGMWQESYSHISPGVVQSEQDIYYFDGDTVISGVTYKKGFSEGAWSFFSGQTTDSGNFKNYFGAMRQDTSERKVYFITTDSSTEEILYNFDLSVGDTLKFLSKYAVDNPLTDSVVVVDSIGLITIDNTERHQFFYHVDVSGFVFPESGSIIEGIGNTHGFIYPLVSPYSSVTNDREIACVSVNAIQIFGTAPVCYLPGYFSTVKPIEDASALIYEFQNGDQLLFELRNPNNKNFTLSIINQLGQVEKEFELNRTQSLVLPHSEFSQGVHVAVLTSDDEILQSLKFVLF